MGVSDEQLREINDKAQAEKQVLMKQAQDDMKQLIDQQSRTAHERQELQAALDREAGTSMSPRHAVDQQLTLPALPLELPTSCLKPQSKHIQTPYSNPILTEKQCCVTIINNR